MLFRFCVLALVLLAGTARAQLITDPAQALAARDTLLQQAARLRQLVQAQSRFFETNARTQSHRTQRVQGTAQLAGPTPAKLTWRHKTRYRRNGRVQEHYVILDRDRIILDEYRLNGSINWLSIPHILPGAAYVKG